MGFLSLDSWGKVLIASAAFMTLASHLCLQVSVSTLFSWSHCVFFFLPPDSSGIWFPSLGAGSWTFEESFESISYQFADRLGTCWMRLQLLHVHQSTCFPCLNGGSSTAVTHLSPRRVDGCSAPWVTWEHKGIQMRKGLGGGGRLGANENCFLFISDSRSMQVTP